MKLNETFSEIVTKNSSLKYAELAVSLTVN